MKTGGKGMGFFTLGVVGLVAWSIQSPWGWAADDSWEPVNQRKIVLFKHSCKLDTEGREDLIHEAGGEPVMELRLINGMLGRISSEAAARLQGHPQIEEVIDDGLVRPIVPLPGAKKLFRPMKLDEDSEIDWGVARIEAPEAWKISQGQGAAVCIIDSGIDRGHPDLAGVYQGGMDFTGSGDLEDELGHGTHVSGIIAARVNGRGVAGVAPRARLFHAKVFSAEGGAPDSAVISGIEYCMGTGARVINMSLGSPDDNEALYQAVRQAARAGIILVAASGNDGKDEMDYPAAYDEVIAVGASDGYDSVADFSNTGEGLDLIAPGAEIFSTVPGGGYERYSGTSMSAPMVSAVAALILNVNPSLAAGQVRRILLESAENLGYDAGAQGAGLVNARAAMEAASSGFSLVSQSRSTPVLSGMRTWAAALSGIVGDATPINAGIEKPALRSMALGFRLFGN
ncbi:MAG: S8 family peptidase [Elusimicrobia bacterium]|nr:S8 family peptidase [Elusimicrobiota bacterium]